MPMVEIYSTKGGLLILAREGETLEGADLQGT